MSQFNYCNTKQADGCYIQIVRVIEPDQYPDASWLEQEGEEERLAAYRNGDFELVHLAAEARCFVVGNGVGVYVNLRSGGIGGVESDSNEEHLDMLYQDEVAALKRMIAIFADPIFEE